METDEILDTSVAIGRNSGNITIFSVIEHPPCSSKNFEVILPDIEDYTKAISIASKLRQKGTPVGAIDMLIAAMCINRRAQVITKEGDYKRIAAVSPEFHLKLL